MLNRAGANSELESQSTGDNELPTATRSPQQSPAGDPHSTETPKTIAVVQNATLQTADLPKSCPYLSTIDRHALDFDFEKLCSVSLSKINVYACLVCGKYFQGRGPTTHANTHAIVESHHVFLNLETHRFYCLPDNYEIKDSSLNDILFMLKPTFNEQSIAELDKKDTPVRAFNGSLYYPGIVGLNNLKHNDYCNVIFHALSNVPPFRNYFLVESNYASSRSTNDVRYLLAIRFGELMRKLMNPSNFKSHVSPHEMLQTIVLCSKKRFGFTSQGNPILFLGWFLASLLGPKRERKSIIERTFRGKVQLFNRQLLPDVSQPLGDDGQPTLIPAPNEQTNLVEFLYLTLDLPAMPLFPKKDEKGQVIKSRVSIHDLLNKFDGQTQQRITSPRETLLRRYELVKLPPYLILYFARFTQNSFFTEKNTHIVDFPMDNLNLARYLHSADQQQPPAANYKLIANIVCDGEPHEGNDKVTYRAHIFHRGTGKWFELQDLYVTEMPDTTLISLSETFIQIWERKDCPPQNKR